VGALRAFPGISEEESPLYDVTPRRGHITMIHDAVLDQIGEELGSAALAVYVVLERRAGKTGTCEPSYDTIAEALKVTRRHVITQVKRLSDAGYVQVKQRRGNDQRHLTNSFTLPHHPTNIDLTPSEPSSPSPSEQGVNKDKTIVNIVHPPSEHPSELGSPKVVTSSQRDNDTPTVNASAFSPRPNTDSAPFITLWSIFDAQRQDVYSLSPAERSKQCAAAARINKVGLTEENVRGIVAWLGGWMSGVDAFDVERSIPKWRAAGMPTGPQEKPKPEKKVAYNSPRAKGPVF